MVNKENVKDAIKTMGNIHVLYMPQWQSLGLGEKPALNKEEFSKRKLTACVAGHIAISSKFIEDGGLVSLSGAPIFNGTAGGEAVAEWLSIPYELAQRICCAGSEFYTDFSSLYGKPTNKITPEDVIKQLEKLI